jgi:hypothetical protein
MQSLAPSTGLHLNAYSGALFPNQIEFLLTAVSNFVRNVSVDTTSLVRIPEQTLQNGSTGKSPQRLITKNTIKTYGRANFRLRRFHILNLYGDKLSDSSSGYFTTIKETEPHCRCMIGVRLCRPQSQSRQCFW